MKLIVATRGSALALWQANYIKNRLENQHPGVTISLNVIKTTGDKILDVPLAKIGGKGLFVKEIESALMDGEADIAVHSMKDVPVDLPPELELYANPVKEVPNDAFLSVKYHSLEELPQGAVVGTSSLRRKLQLVRINPLLKIKELRGNVDTRIRKMTDGEYDAIILAEAGLKRLGFTEHIKQSIPVDVMLPAVCQGVLGIEVRRNDTRTKDLIHFLKDADTETAVTAERAFLAGLNGGCQTPIACHAVLSGNTIHITGYLSDLEGKKIIRHTLSGAKTDPAALGSALAEKILESGGDKILKEIYA